MDNKYHPIFTKITKNRLLLYFWRKM